MSTRVLFPFNAVPAWLWLIVSYIRPVITAGPASVAVQLAYKHQATLYRVEDTRKFPYSLYVICQRKYTFFFMKNLHTYVLRTFLFTSKYFLEASRVPEIIARTKTIYTVYTAKVIFPYNFIHPR